MKPKVVQIKPQQAAKIPMKRRTGGTHHQSPHMFSSSVRVQRKAQPLAGTKEYCQADPQVQEVYHRSQKHGSGLSGE